MKSLLADVLLLSDVMEDITKVSFLDKGTNFALLESPSRLRAHGPFVINKEVGGKQEFH